MLHAAGLTVPRGEKAPIVAVSPMPADFRALGFTTPDAAQDVPSEALPEATDE
jgi:tRNA pseudouridine32 synthase/23S rRNA pseudouridine746 synthase